jgi:hypothetical protein
MRMNKNAMTQMKALFLIVNLVVAVLAFSVLISSTNATTVTTTPTDSGWFDKTTGILSINNLQDETPLNMDFQPANLPAGSTHTSISGSVTGSNGQDLGNLRRYGNDVFGSYTPAGENPEIKWERLENGGDLVQNGRLGYREIEINGQTAYRNGDSIIMDNKPYTLGKDEDGNPILTPKAGAEGEKGPSSITAEKFISSLAAIGGMFTLGYFIGGLIGDNADIALGTALAVGTTVYTLFGKGGMLSTAGTKMAFLGSPITAAVIAAVVFVALYKKEDVKRVEFNCLPWEPPIGGEDCEKCNTFGECSEYRCKSLGQACQLLNEGSEDEKCAWVNPGDVNSPKIKMTEVLKDHVFRPDNSIRPPATGVEIRDETNPGGCVDAFTPLEFTLETDEPAQCKIDYNITRKFENMNYFIGGSNLFSYNHTETMSLPGADTINALAPELKNDGTYTLYAKCQDANGNSNEDLYSIRFCVNPGPDTTPPRIDDVSTQSGMAIRYNQTDLDLEVYVNENAECRWSREDKDYDLMENNMSCELDLWDMKKINNKWVYTCETTLQGIQNRQDNYYYFRCKDKPHAAEPDRNTNTQSFLYNIIGTQPLTLLSFSPEEGDVIKGATNVIPLFLEAETDNGYRNGESICSFIESDTEPDSEDYIDFLETGGSTHSQRLDLPAGSYHYYIKCVDLGGNAIYEEVNFEVEADSSGPKVVRAYKSSGQLRIFTDEKAECAYSNKDCNFEIDEGISMVSVRDQIHATDWELNKNFYIRCKDEFGNEPAPQEGNNGCSIVVKPYQIFSGSNVVEL